MPDLRGAPPFLYDEPLLGWVGLILSLYLRVCVCVTILFVWVALNLLLLG